MRPGVATLAQRAMISGDRRPAFALRKRALGLLPESGRIHRMRLGSAVGTTWCRPDEQLEPASEHWRLVARPGWDGPECAAPAAGELGLSEKHARVSDMIRRGKNAKSLDDRILKAIGEQSVRPVFSGRDFLNLGSRAAVDQVLSRLARKGVIRRLRRGLYDVPRQSPVLGTLSPDPIVVAQAAAAGGSSRLQASGAYAANLLGLSEQVPGRIVFLTDGNTRRVTIGRQVIELRRASPRNLIGAGTTAGTAFQALRYVGSKGVTAKEVGILRRTLSPQDRRALAALLPQAPVWMHPVLARIAE